MDGLTLLSGATAAGLTVWADAGRLVIRGPREAGPVARRLLEHKPVVLAALGVDANPGGDGSKVAENVQNFGQNTPTNDAQAHELSRLPADQQADGWPLDTIAPGEPCPVCGSLEKWFDPWDNEHCQRCEADKLRRAERLADRAARLRRKHPSRQKRVPDAVRGATEAAGPTRNTSDTSGVSRGNHGLLQGRENG